MPHKTFIGLDFGSDSVRALLVDSQGNELATAVHEYSRWQQQQYCNAEHYQFRQHPLDYLEGMENVVKEVLQYSDPSLVAGISVDTTASTPCAVDRNGTPLAMHEEFADDPDAMFVLWKDHTAIAEELRINQIAQNWQMDYRKYSGGHYSCEWFWSKILHVLRNNEAVRKNSFSFIEHCDWIIGVLTGNTNPLSILRNCCTAGHKAMWNKQWNGLPSQEFLIAVDPLLGSLPAPLYDRVYPAGYRAGFLTREWQEKLGLKNNVAIGVGAIDCHAGAVGAGITPGEMVKVLGTSTCDILAAPDNGICIEGICGQAESSVLPGVTGFEAGQAAFGDIYNWFKRFLSYAGDVDLNILEKEAAALPVGTGGVIALDWFNGRRTPYANSLLNGMIGNLNLGTTVPMVYRALAESTVMGSKAIFEHFKQSGIEIKAITAAGGISYKSEFIMQMLADALHMPVKVVKTKQSCALGAAMFAAVAAEEYPTVEDASQAMNSKYCKVYLPDHEKYELYQNLYQRYLVAGKCWEDLTAIHSHYKN